MDLNPYVDRLRQELVMAAEAGGDEAWMLAERLAGPLESATRLGLLEALSEAAGEITRDLAPGSVEVRLRGRDPEFVVTAPSPDESSGGPSEGAFGADDATGVPPPVAPARSDDEGEGGGTSRITLRLPTHLKPRIDEAADRAGLSANAWLVRAIAAALEPADRSRPASRRLGPAASGSRYKGWVR